ncbi:nicotinamide-nucleotide amidohydrolase family protein [uncultured Paraglaciecola sp.]|uniref:CinA family protein n=1 Tax=uncultured Paraglaciecola sp. TaxID=1765024 RepID=UPI0030D795C2|tara:strand:+ start:138118 stop:138603 length:486 start_codon:yes stop_codon:yes gene_type:complete
MTADITQLAQLLGNKLAAKGWQISCAESCTGGGVGYAITSISGSSAWFKKGFITYSNDAKQQMLGVSEHTLNQYGAVSAQTVEEMAVGAATYAKAEVAVAISGIAGPDGGTPEKPVGTVWFGFFIDGQSSSQKLLIDGNRETVRIKAIEFALSNTLQLLPE